MDKEGVDIAANAAHIAGYLHKSYSMVEKEDILQEVWLWVYSKPDKVDEYQDGTELGRNKLLKAMRNAGIRFCQAEKARVLGYRPEDNYFYTPGAIRAALELIWDSEAWSNPPAPVDQIRAMSRDVSEGGNYITTLADVSRAVALLPLREQALLRARYYEGLTAAEIADRMDATVSSVDSRIGRIVRRVQRHLGGERPQVD